MTEHTNTIGSINVARGVLDHTLFAPEPFTEREVRMWLAVGPGLCARVCAPVRAGGECAQCAQLGGAHLFRGAR